MQRLFFPVLLLVLVGTILFSERPGMVGDLIALAENWDQWSEPSGGASPRNYVPPVASPPVRPSASPRPASWPGSPAPEMVNQSSGEVQISDLQSGSAVRQDQQVPPDWRVPNAAPNANPNRRVPELANLPQRTMSPENPALDNRSSRNTQSRMRGRGRPGQSDDTAPIEGSQIVAKVGFEVILAREVSMGAPRLRQFFQQKFEENKDKGPPELLQSQLKEAMDAQLLVMMQKQLEGKIEDKLLYLGATRQLPAEGIKQLKELIGKDYESKVVPQLMKAYKAGSRRELEEQIEQMEGISLDLHKRQFVEHGLGRWWLEKEVKADDEVSHEELLTYYRDHAAEFEKPGQARWEHLMVRKSSDPGQAYAKLAWMGNQVLDGVPFADVAKAHSQGTTAQQGGKWDWTAQGSLNSKILDKALFSRQLKPGELSPIFEDDQGYHIIRIVEREETQRQPFIDAQVKIREKFVGERKADAKAVFLARLRKQTPVWTAPHMQADVQSPNGLRLFN